MNIKTDRESVERDAALAEVAQIAAQADYEARIHSAIEAPDHLALVAAAYREVVRNILGVTILVAPDGISHREGAESVRRQLAGFIETLTPADAEAHLTALLRAEYERGKAETNALWGHNSRETFEAMCAMRDAINEHVPMPSLESDLLQGPEASVFCAAVAEAVIGALLTQGER